MWIVMAVLSAVFAGATSILAKCGIKKTDSDIATALRTVVVLAFSWIVLKQKLDKKAIIGLLMMVAGTLVMTVFA